MQEILLDRNRGLDALKDSNLLDVGCGLGHQSIAFSQYLKVQGLDRVDECSELFQELGLSIPVHTCDMENDTYPLSDGSVDYVFSKSVIEHLDKWDHYLNEIKRVLNPKGKLVLMTPSWTSSPESFYDDPTHISPFTPISLRKALQMAGMVDVEVKEFYQLPFTWKYPYLKFVPRIIGTLPDSMKWKNSKKTIQRTWVRFSKEKMLLAVAKK